MSCKLVFAPCKHITTSSRLPRAWQKSSSSLPTKASSKNYPSPETKIGERDIFAPLAHTQTTLPPSPDRSGSVLQMLNRSVPRCQKPPRVLSGLVFFFFFRMEPPSMSGSGRCWRAVCASSRLACVGRLCPATRKPPQSGSSSQTCRHWTPGTAEVKRTESSVSCD